MSKLINFSPDFIMFDLDGTLVDSAPDIALATNKLLQTKGYEPLELDQVRSMIGNGIKTLVQRAFAAHGQELGGVELEEMTDQMMDIYADYLTVKTALMPGAEEALRTFHARGVTLGVVTNKPEGFSRTILEHFGFMDMVSVVVGGDTGPERKPAPDMLLYAIEQASARPETSLMVGDSPADIDSAKNANVKNMAIRGGYTNIPVEELGADVVLNSLADVAHKLG